MAIYHLHIDSYRRSRGRTAVGGMAYRRGVKAGCRHSGKHYNFRGKGEVVYSGFVAVDGDKTDYSKLENLIRLYEAVEQQETHCRATVGREIEAALPNELTLDQQIELIQGFIQEVKQSADAERAFFDFSIHHKPNNPHVHICMSEREQLSPFVFSKTKRRHWDGKDFIKQCRQLWERHTNTALLAAGVDQRVDCRSHADRGLSVLPSLHEGKAAYFNSEVKTMNGQIKETNESIKKKREMTPFVPVPEAPVPTFAASDQPEFDDDAEWGIQCEDEPAAHDLRRLLKDKYNHYFGFSKHIVHVELKGEYAILHFKDRSTITDQGGRIIAEGSNPQLSAYRIIELATAKGWHSVSFTGDDDFLRCAFLRAIEQGMEVVPKNENQALILAEIRTGGGSMTSEMTDTSMIVPLGESFQERMRKHSIKPRPSPSPQLPSEPRRKKKSGS